MKFALIVQWNFDRSLEGVSSTLARLKIIRRNALDRPGKIPRASTAKEFDPVPLETIPQLVHLVLILVRQPPTL